MPTRRARGERGAALVEAAIMMPIIIMLTFGVIEFGFAFNEQGTVRASTRSAARAISTVPKEPNPVFYNTALESLNASMQNLTTGEPDFALIYQQAPGGAPEPTSIADCLGYAEPCMVFDWPTGGPFQTFAAGTGTPWDPDDRNACAGSTSIVGVYVEIDHAWVTGLPFLPGFGEDTDLSSSTVMALEPFPGTGPTCS